MENGHKIRCVMWCASVPFFLYPREMVRTAEGNQESSGCSFHWLEP